MHVHRKYSLYTKSNNDILNKWKKWHEKQGYIKCFFKHVGSQEKGCKFNI